MKHIGVYTICKNEAKFVRQWVTSMWCNGNGADKAYILDTGSIDETVQLFDEVIKDLGIPEGWLKLKQKTYEMFRFDTARNDNLDMIKEDEDYLDALISVDLDETLTEDFWSDLRHVVKEHPNFNRIYYMYAWNHDEDKNPKRVFWYDKIHPVKGARWIHPVHEELIIDNPDAIGKYYMDENKIYLHHWMDTDKPRSSYLPLLKIRAQENPDDIYGLFYLMRELLFQDQGSFEALAVANYAYMKLNNIEDEYDCLPFFFIAIADIYKYYNLKEEAEHFYRRALMVGQKLRQPYISYALFLAYQGRYEEALNLMEVMEEIAPIKYSTWYECDYNWTWRPLQIKAVAKCWAGEYEQAKDLFEQAKNNYIKTPTDIQEATRNGFYADYQWLIDYLK